MATKGKGVAKKKAMGPKKAAKETFDVLGMVLESRIDEFLEGIVDTLGLATKTDLRAIENRCTALEKKLGKKTASKKKTAKKASRKKMAKKKAVSKK